jgi:Acyl-CoA reductase (LuxC)
MMSGLNLALHHGASPDTAAAQAPMAPFAPLLVAFVGDLSRHLLADPSIRPHPELVALAYWMRAANVQRLKADFTTRMRGDTLVPRGTVFHIAPSNVDTIFVYSWILSLLSGNRNVVRLSSRSSVQLDLLLGGIDNCLAKPEFAAVASRIAIVRYEHSEAISTALSALADTRVIWGGDNTVAAIRKLPLPATANEVAFANKLSLALLDTEYWACAEDAARQTCARLFANDAYWFGQAACSSPRVLLWHGRAPSTAESADFWLRVLQASRDIPGELSAVDFIDKLVSADRVAAEMAAQFAPSTDNRLSRVSIALESLPTLLQRDIHCGGGLFFECTLPHLDGLAPSLSRRIQTLAYAGLPTETLRQWLQASPLAGIDRVVPFGRALDFAHVWDGFDFLEVLMRRITVA